MPATIQFVDSVAPSPTVRLDVNDGSTWFCTDFSAPPPRLRRSESANAMRDGGIVGASSYENRTLTLELTLVNASTEDAAATEIQKLWRELDRSTNWLRYQREGMSKPVFFRLFRSDASDLEELWTTPIARNITLELLAEPFALGLRETSGPFTVPNDPMTIDATRFTILAANSLGDVPAPLVATTSTTALGLVLAAGLSVSYSAEQAALGTDTTNPGGAADAAMSGVGSTNFRRTSFATNTTMVARLDTATVAGTYRVFVYLRRSDATSVFNVRGRPSTFSTVPPGPTVKLPLTTQRRLVDLGTMTFGVPGRLTGYGSTENSGTAARLRIEAERVSGSGAIDWDHFLLVPADRQLLIAKSSSTTPQCHTVDGVTETAFSHAAGDPVTGAGTIGAVDQVAGGFPMVNPGVANIYTFLYQAGDESNTVSSSTTVAASYWPRYLHVRPVSS